MSAKLIIRISLIYSLMGLLITFRKAKNKDTKRWLVLLNGMMVMGKRKRQATSSSPGSSQSSLYYNHKAGANDEPCARTSFTEVAEADIHVMTSIAETTGIVPTSALQFQNDTGGGFESLTPEDRSKAARAGTERYRTAWSLRAGSSGRLGTPTVHVFP